MAVRFCSMLRGRHNPTFPGHMSFHFVPYYYSKIRVKVNCRLLHYHVQNILTHFVTLPRKVFQKKMPVKRYRSLMILPNTVSFVCFHLIVFCLFLFCTSVPLFVFNIFNNNNVLHIWIPDLLQVIPLNSDSYFFKWNKRYKRYHSEHRGYFLIVLFLISSVGRHSLRKVVPSKD